MQHKVYMSCGHTEIKDLATTGEQLKIDLQYFARQGLCAECWAKLIKQNNERKEKEIANKKFISVKEAYPKDGEHVLIKYKGNGDDEHIIKGFYYKNGGKPTFASYGSEVSDVIAWAYR